MRNPHQVTKDFEQALCEYTGAPFAVCVNSCTMALLLAVAWNLRRELPPASPLASLMQHPRPRIEIPKRTYVSVAMAIMHAGGRPAFRDEDWLGAYQLFPLNVWDSARWFTSNIWNAPKLYAPWVERERMVCASFHASKTLGLEQGGAILHGNPEADAWLRRARFDGRTEGVAPKDDDFNMLAWHAYMNPSTAAQGILRLHSLPRHNEPLPNDEYPDLSQMDIFK